MLEADRYLQMVCNARPEIRAKAIVSLVEMLIENDRIDGLELQVSIDAEVRDDPGTVVPLVERFVATHVRRLAGTMRVALSVQGIYDRPQHAFRLMEMLLNDLDAHEDPDTLLALALSGEEPTFVLENLARYIYADPGIHLEDIIEHIEPAVMRAIANVLSANSLDAEPEPDDFQRRQRMATLIRTFVTMPDAALFFESPITTKSDVLMSQMLHIDDESDEEFVVRNTVAMSVFYHDTYGAAYGAMESYLDMLNTNAHPRLPLLQQAMVHLQTIYGVDHAQD